MTERRDHAGNLEYECNRYLRCLGIIEYAPQRNIAVGLQSLVECNLDAPEVS